MCFIKRMENLILLKPFKGRFALPSAGFALATQTGLKRPPS